jgi:hypothetical protein
MATATEPQAGLKPVGAKRETKRRGGRRPRKHSPEIVRYFVGRPGDGNGKPTLEQELASEPEALVIAFKGDSQVYLVSEYRVMEKIEGGQVRLEKEPVAGNQRVSTTNAS